MEVTKQQQQVHFVLVHGAGHGAWCWYKMMPLLKAAGHRVTTLDLAASGTDMRSLQEVQTLHHYTQPLLELIAQVPDDEKVILVGHSLGGMNLSLAMEMHPKKIKTAVFIAAFMPDTTHRPSYVIEQYHRRFWGEHWLDTEFSSYGTLEEPRTSMFFGSKFISSKLYTLCPPQDVALAEMLVRPSSLFVEDMSKKAAFTEDRYGSVKKVYIVCVKDQAMPVDFQRWQIEIVGVNKVKEIESAGHMAMLSNPQQVFQALLDIAEEYV